MPATGRFVSPIDDRYLEDYVPGSVHECGQSGVSEAEIIDFATRFDPQYFHVDPRAAEKSDFGGLIASGWHTCAIMMRLLADHYLSHNASLGSPGVDELRWWKPVRPGDVLRLRVTVRDATRSKSRPGRGTVHSFVELTNQDEDVVLSMTAVNFIRAREHSG